MVSAAWRAVAVVELWATSRNSRGAVLPQLRVLRRGGALRLPAPARAPVLAASLWPLVLVLERAVVSSPPRAPVQALAVALLMPRAPALQRVVLMPREPPRVLAFVPTRALVLQGPC